MFLTVLVLRASHAQAEDSIRKAIVEERRGEVQVRIGGDAWEPATPGVVLREMDEIKTGVQSYAALLIPMGKEASRIELQERTHLRLSTMIFDPMTKREVTLIDLALGKVRVHAAPLNNPKSKFEVRTPTSTSGVKGTIFEVWSEGAFEVGRPGR